MSMLDSLHASYLATHWRAMDENIKQHLAGFVAHVQTAVESIEPIAPAAPELTAESAAEFLTGLGYTVSAPGAAIVQMETPALAQAAPMADPVLATAVPMDIPVLAAAAPIDAPTLGQADPQA